MLLSIAISRIHSAPAINDGKNVQLPVAALEMSSLLGSFIGSVVNGLGVFGLKDSSEQGPVDGPRLDGFGAVGAAAVHALLADVDLPAAEIGGGWFHGLGVGG